MESALISEAYQDVLDKNVRPFVQKFEAELEIIPSIDNYPKHTRKSTKEWFKNNKLNWPCQSPGLNFI